MEFEHSKGDEDCDSSSTSVTTDGRLLIEVTIGGEALLMTHSLEMSMAFAQAILDRQGK